MKNYKLKFMFLNTKCELEYANLDDFCRKLDEIKDTPEILVDSIIISTEEKK